MPTYIAMLRGINVGGHNKMPMERLRSICEGLGLKQVRTLIQSGNLVFEAAKCNPDSLSARIEKKILSEFGFEVRVITRTPEEVGRVIERNPFPKESKTEPGKVYVAFLAEVAKPDALKNLESKATADERVQRGEREVYLYYRNGMGQAKLTSNVLERVLAVAATARNWNTVTKLYEMAGKS